jgi:hypothetical protein
MSNPRITYDQHSNSTPQTELSALANIYRLVVESAKKKAAPASGPSDGTKTEGDSADVSSLPH